MHVLVAVDVGIVAMALLAAGRRRPLPPWIVVVLSASLLLSDLDRLLNL